MYRTLESYKIRIVKMDDGQWWFHADTTEAMHAIEEMLKQIKRESNV